MKEISEPSHFDINALLYMSALTAKEHLNNLKEISKQRPKKTESKWLNNIESKISALRKKIGELTTLINCKISGNFTNHQKEIKEMFHKRYGNTRMQTLRLKLTLLKQNLKVTSSKLKWLKKNHQRQAINGNFSSNPKSVYCKFKGKRITLNEMPAKK